MLFKINNKNEDVQLFAPVGYWLLTPDEKKDICNGCGSQGILGWLVPDTMYLLCVKEACNIHDYMYEIGETNEDKEVADRVFINNMTRVINAKGGIFRKLRLRRARTYHKAAVEFGVAAFWDGKNDFTEFRLSHSGAVDV